MGKKVLIVDDNQTIRDLVAFTLRLSKYETICANDGQDALSVLDRKDSGRLA